MTKTDRAGTGSPDTRDAWQDHAAGCADGLPIELPSEAFDEFMHLLGESSAPGFESFRSGSTRWGDANRPPVGPGRRT